MITDKKKSINEYRYMSGGSVSKTINDPDLYVFATQVIVPLCMKYAKYAFYAKVKTSAIKGRNGNDLHRAAFKMELQSLNSQAKSLHKVLCKIYKTDKMDDTIAIDYNAIADGYYDYFASIIDGTVYFMPLSELYRYQSEMGNACITKGGKYMAVIADYFIDHATESYAMDQADIAEYEKAYDRYVNKSYKLTESQNTMTENIDIEEKKKAVSDWVRKAPQRRLSKKDELKVMHILVDLIYDNMDIPEPNHTMNSTKDLFTVVCQFIANTVNADIQSVLATIYWNQYIANMFLWAFRKQFKYDAKNIHMLDLKYISTMLIVVGAEIEMGAIVLENKKYVTNKEKALLEKLSKLTGIRSKSFDNQVLDVIRNR